jgi:hypothetical protein
MAISYDYMYIYILAYKLYSMHLYVNVVSIIYGRFVDL